MWSSIRKKVTALPSPWGRRRLPFLEPWPPDRRLHGGCRRLVVHRYGALRPGPAGRHGRRRGREPASGGRAAHPGQVGSETYGWFGFQPLFEMISAPRLSSSASFTPKRLDSDCLPPGPFNIRGFLGGPQGGVPIGLTRELGKQNNASRSGQGDSHLWRSRKDRVDQLFLTAEKLAKDYSLPSEGQGAGAGSREGPAGKDVVRHQCEAS